MKKNIVLSVSVSLVAKLMLLVQSSVVAAVYGASADADIIFYMMNLIVSITTFASAVNQLVCVANIMRIRQADTEAVYQGFMRFLYTIYLGVGLFFGVAFFFFGKQILMAVTEFSAAQIDTQLPMIRIMAIVLGLSVINAYLIDTFASFKIFVMPMVNDLIKSALIIGFVLTPAGRADIAAVALGMLAAYAIQFVTVQILFRRVSGFAFRPGWICRSAATGGMRKNLFAVFAAQCASFIESIITLGIISGLPVGYLTAVALARKLSQTVLNVLIVQFAMVVGIELIEANNAGDHEKLSAVFTRYFMAANFILLPITACLFINSKLIIRLFFGYGKFNDGDVQIAASVLAILSFMLMSVLWDTFLQRLVVAKQLQDKIFQFQILQSAIRLAMMVVLTQIFGYIGIAIGLVAGNVIFVLMLGTWLFSHDYRFLKISGVVRYTAVNAVFAAVAGAAGGLLLWRIPEPEGVGGVILTLLVSVACVLGVYVGIALTLKSNRDCLRTALSIFKIKSIRGTLSRAKGGAR